MIILFILAIVLLLLVVYSITKCVRSNVEYYSYLKQFKQCDKKKVAREKIILGSKLNRIDDLFDSTFYSKEDVFKIKQITKSSDIDSAITLLKKFYDEKRFNTLKGMLKSIETDFLLDLKNCKYEELDTLLCKMNIALNNIEKISTNYSLDKEIEYVAELINKLKEVNRGELKIAVGDSNVLRSHILMSVEKINTLNNAVAYEIKTNYNYRKQRLRLENYNILDYNDEIVKQLHSLNNEELLKKVINCFNGLGFTTDILGDNIVKVGIPKNELCFVVALVRQDDLTLNKSSINVELINDVINLANKEGVKYTKITILTNLDFKADAFKMIENNEKLECLTLFNLLQVSLLSKDDLKRKHVSLIGEIIKKRETMV